MAMETPRRQRKRHHSSQLQRHRRSGDVMTAVDTLPRRSVEIVIAAVETSRLERRRHHYRGDVSAHRCGSEDVTIGAATSPLPADLAVVTY